jgi:hypothetical protein
MSSERRHKIEITVKGKKKTKYVSAKRLEKMGLLAPEKPLKHFYNIGSNKPIPTLALKEEFVLGDHLKDLPKAILDDSYKPWTNKWLFPLFDYGTNQIIRVDADPVGDLWVTGSYTLDLPTELTQEDQSTVLSSFPDTSEFVSKYFYFLQPENTPALKFSGWHPTFQDVERTGDARRFVVYFTVHVDPDSGGASTPSTVRADYVRRATEAIVREGLILTFRPIRCSQTSFHDVYNAVIVEGSRQIGVKNFKERTWERITGEYKYGAGLRDLKIFVEMFHHSDHITDAQLVKIFTGQTKKLLFKPRTQKKTRLDFFNDFANRLEEMGLVRVVPGDVYRYYLTPMGRNLYILLLSELDQNGKLPEDHHFIGYRIDSEVLP